MTGSGRKDSMVEAMAKSAARTVGSTVGTRDRARRAGFAARRQQAAMRRSANTRRSRAGRIRRGGASCGIASGCRSPGSRWRRCRRRGGAAADAADRARPVLSAAEARGQDADLTQVAGTRRRARRARSSTSTGRVLDVDGRPLAARRARAVAGQRVRPLPPSRGHRRVGSARPRLPGLRTPARRRRWAVSASRRSSRAPYSGRTPHIHFNVASARHAAHDADVLRGRARQRARRALPLAVARRPARIDGSLSASARRRDGERRTWSSCGTSCCAARPDERSCARRPCSSATAAR